LNSVASPQPIAVLISGRGSNMLALAAASREPPRSYELALVLSDRPAAAGLAAARDLGLATLCVPAARDLGSATLGVPVARELGPTARGSADQSAQSADFEHRLGAALDACAPALIVLAGFMRILSAQFVHRYAGRIVNIHPSLLPAYAGLHTHRRVLAAGDPVHGATVHFVTAELDGGPAIIQARLNVNPDDDEATLAARVLALEHEIYPLAVRWFCEGRLCCRGGQAWLDGVALAAPVLYAGATSPEP
jgi:phosphoribosylglycinamide formyltransferase-1